jgi:4-hydroxyacetophenone monooxygenase
MIPSKIKAVEVISEDDAFIEAALKDANVPALLMTLVHLTGNTDVLTADLEPHVSKVLNINGVYDDAQREKVRALALEAIRTYRDKGCPALPNPSAQTVRQMAHFLIGADIEEDFLESTLEEMGFSELDRKLDWSSADAAAGKDNFSVLIIGGGLAGILNAIRLSELGISYTVIEKNADVGGVWLENTYPGCRVDLPSHFYSYSFEMVAQWTKMFSVRDDVFAYFTGIVEKYGVRQNIEFESEVEEAVWSEEDQMWTVSVRRNDGTIDRLIANVVITAVGQLSRPKYPEIAGQEKYQGISSHTCGYDRSIQLEGKRVAVIGAGASAFQAVPEVGKLASRLTVFQRSPTWLIPTPEYYNEVTPAKTWLLSHIPFYADWFRFNHSWTMSDAVIQNFLQIDPTWPHQKKSVSATSEIFRVNLTEYMKSQLTKRPEMLDKILPDYPPMAKVAVKDNGRWLATLQEDNVDLVTCGIQSMDETGIIDNDGVHHQVDVIIYATGFLSYKVLYPMRFIGRDGIELNEYWGDQPTAYLGMTVPNFPNLFMVWGPGSSAPTSAIMFTEWTSRYIHDAIIQMVENGITAMEPMEDLYFDYNERAQARREMLVFNAPGISNWFKDPSGKITSALPWKLTEYWRMVRNCDLGDYVLTRREVERRLQSA